MLGIDSIQKRLALIVALGSLSFAIVVGMVAYAVEYHAQFRQANQLRDQLVATVRTSAAISAFVGNEDIAKEVIEGLLANPLVASVEIHSVSGFKQTRSRNLAKTGEAVIYPLFSPVAQSDQVGELRVRQDVALITQQARQAALLYAALLIAQIAISAILLMLIFGRVVGWPLTRVARQLESVSPGGSARIFLPEEHARDEIGMLVNSSNALLAATEAAILKEREIQAEMDAMAAHYRRIFENTNVGVMILDPEGHLLNCNDALKQRIIGRQHADVLAQLPQGAEDEFFSLVFEEPDKVWEMVREAQDSGQPVAGDLRIRPHAAEERWVHCVISIREEDGRLSLIEGVLYDVTARRRRESEARRAAEVDLLTGLANRRGMELFLEQCLPQAANNALDLAMLMLDLDGFKAINDSFGHAAGDLVLQTVAHRLGKIVRRGDDLVARLGGDEFVVIVTARQVTPASMEQIASHLLKQITLPIELEEGGQVQVGASIGISIYPDDGLTRDALLQAADAAMYEVKRRGKNAYAFASTLSLPDARPAAKG